MKIGNLTIKLNAPAPGLRLIAIDPQGNTSWVNEYVHPDSHSAEMIENDATHRFVTDAQISLWNAKASVIHSHAASEIIQTPSYRFVTDSQISLWNANASNIHSHAATDIIQTPSYRFVTDVEKTTWNSAGGILKNLNAPEAFNYGMPIGANEFSPYMDIYVRYLCEFANQDDLSFDSAGNGSGVVVGTVLPDSSGRGAIFSAGNSHYIELGNDRGPVSRLLLVEPLTIELTVIPYDVITNQTVFALSTNCLLFIENGKFRFRGNSTNHIVDKDLHVGESYALAIMRNVNGTVYIYVNGSLYLGPEANTSVWYSGTAWILGAGGAYPGFSGVIQEFRVSIGIQRYSGSSYSVTTFNTQVGSQRNVKYMDRLQFWDSSSKPLTILSGFDQRPCLMFAKVNPIDADSGYGLSINTGKAPTNQFELRTRYGGFGMAFDAWQTGITYSRVCSLTQQPVAGMVNANAMEFRMLVPGWNYNAVRLGIEGSIYAAESGKPKEGGFLKLSRADDSASLLLSYRGITFSPAYFNAGIPSEISMASPIGTKARIQFYNVTASEKGGVFIGTNAYVNTSGNIASENISYGSKYLYADMSNTDWVIGTSRQTNLYLQGTVDSYIPIGMTTRISHATITGSTYKSVAKLQAGVNPKGATSVGGLLQLMQYTAAAGEITKVDIRGWGLYPNYMGNITITDAADYGHGCPEGLSFSYSYNNGYIHRNKTPLVTTVAEFKFGDGPLNNFSEYFRMTSTGFQSFGYTCIIGSSAGNGTPMIELNHSMAAKPLLIKARIAGVVTEDIASIGNILARFEGEVTTPSLMADDLMGSYAPCFVGSEGRIMRGAFGTTAYTVAEGNHNHAGIYLPAGYQANYKTNVLYTPYSWNTTHSQWESSDAFYITNNMQIVGTITANHINVMGLSDHTIRGMHIGHDGNTSFLTNTSDVGNGFYFRTKKLTDQSSIDVAVIDSIGLYLSFLKDKGDRPLKTGNDGRLYLGDFGTSAGQFSEGNHNHNSIYSATNHSHSSFSSLFINNIGDTSSTGLHFGQDGNSAFFINTGTTGNGFYFKRRVGSDTMDSALIDSSGILLNGLAGPDIRPLTVSINGRITAGQFGTGAGMIAVGDHNHNEIYSAILHNHDSAYSASGHFHSYPSIPGIPLVWDSDYSRWLCSSPLYVSGGNLATATNFSMLGSAGYGPTYGFHMGFRADNNNEEAQFVVNASQYRAFTFYGKVGSSNLVTYLSLSNNETYSVPSLRTANNVIVGNYVQAAGLIASSWGFRADAVNHHNVVVDVGSYMYNHYDGWTRFVSKRVDTYPSYVFESNNNGSSKMLVQIQVDRFTGAGDVVANKSLVAKGFDSTIEEGVSIQYVEGADNCYAKFIVKNGLSPSTGGWPHMTFNLLDAAGISNELLRLDINTIHLNRDAIPSSTYGDTLMITATGQLVRNTSSIRFKDNVIPITYDPTVIERLKPVSFYYKNDENRQRRTCGLIAEETIAILPNVVNKDSEGIPCGIHYEGIIPFLILELQELRKEISNLKHKRGVM